MRRVPRFDSLLEFVKHAKWLMWDVYRTRYKCKYCYCDGGGDGANCTGKQSAISRGRSCCLINSDEAEDADDSAVVDPEAEVVNTQVMLRLLLKVYTTGGQNTSVLSARRVP